MKRELFSPQFFLFGLVWPTATSLAHMVVVPRTFAPAADSGLSVPVSALVPLAAISILGLGRSTRNRHWDLPILYIPVGVTVVMAADRSIAVFATWVSLLILALALTACERDIRQAVLIGPLVAAGIFLGPVGMFLGAGALMACFFLSPWRGLPSRTGFFLVSAAFPFLFAGAALYLAFSTGWSGLLPISAWAQLLAAFQRMDCATLVANWLFPAVLFLLLLPAGFAGGRHDFTGFRLSIVATASTAGAFLWQVFAAPTEAIVLAQAVYAALLVTAVRQSGAKPTHAASCLSGPAMSGTRAFSTASSGCHAQIRPKTAQTLSH